LEDKLKRALWTVQRACSGRELCRDDIASRLKRFELTEKELDDIISSLEKDDFLSHERYTRAFTRDKSSLSGWGPAKIAWALRAKKIEEELIKSALEEISGESTTEKLNDILSKKYKTLEKETNKLKVKSKLVRFVISRGFDYGSVISQVNKLMANFVTEINN
jgi:regulatory protein